MPKSSFKEKLYTFLNIDYKPKSRAYWIALAIPQLMFLLFLIYVTAGIMVRHFYGYIDHNSHLNIPMVDWFVANAAGMKDEEHAAKADGDAKKDIALLKEMKEETIFDKKAHFHNLVKDPTEEGKQPVCFYCHGNYPHKKQKMIRSILNMHTQFIDCSTCHVDNIPEEQIEIKWVNYSGIKPKGKPFGLSYDLHTGSLAKTDDYYSKISAFVDGKMLEIPEDAPDAQDFIKIRGQLTPSEQAKVKARFHRNIGAKGRFCTRCHITENSFMPFKELGFSEQRINDLTGLNVVSITQKYKEFYMPGIFKDMNISPEKAQELLGKGVDKPISELPADPTTWWRNKFTAPAGEEAPFAGTPAKK